MKDCWNCGCSVAVARERCPDCGQWLSPDLSQRERALDNITYMISEIRRWKSVPEWWKKEAESSYQLRSRKLHDWVSEVTAFSRPADTPEAPLPETEPVPAEPLAAAEILAEEFPSPAVPVVKAVPRAPRRLDPTPFQQMLGEQPSETGQGGVSGGGADPSGRRLEEPRAYQPPAPAEPAAPSEADVAMRMLMDAFSEKKIRLLYALGGVLLLSAGVGTLRSSWDGWGRQVMALLLATLPLLFFWLASRVREQLPVSSRMFTVLGGAMLPMGVLFLNTFGVAGLHAPAELWNPLAFGLGCWVNAVLARRAEEPLCTYLAGLCWALAAWSTGNGLILGIASFAGAAGLFWTSAADPHRARVGHSLSALGLLAAFTRGPLQTGSAATLFLSAIIYFTAMAWVARTPLALTISSLICIVSSWWLSSLLGWPASSVGLLALLQGGFYLVRSRKLEGASADAAETLAIYLTGCVLVMTLGLPMMAEFLKDVKDFPPHQLQTMALTGLLAAAYYAGAAYHYRRPGWLYGSALSLFYGYFAMLALSFHEHAGAYRPWLLGLALLLQAGALALRGRVGSDYLRPWALTSVAVALLLLPVNMLLQVVGQDGLTPWIYLGAALSTTLAALFEREPRGLYASCLVAALAYATWLPIWFGTSNEPNIGFAFTPFVSVLALLGLLLRKGLKREGAPDYGTPLLITAGVAGWGFSLLQAAYLLGGYWKTAPPALVFYGLAAALCGWSLPDHRRYFYFHSGLCLLTAVACLDRMGTLGLGTGLLLAAGLFGLASAGWLEAAALWSAVVAWTGPEELRIFPGLIWLAAAVHPRISRTHRENLALASTALFLPAWPACWKDWPNFGLLLGALAQAGLAWRWQRSTLLALAWVQLKVVYLCAFGLTGKVEWTFALWVEWLGIYWINSRLEKPEVSLEGLTMATLLGVSAYLGGLFAVINPWLVGLVLLTRASQSRHQSLFSLAQLVLAWACWATAHEARAPGLLASLLFGWALLSLVLGQRFRELRTWHHQAVSVFSLLGWLAAFQSPSTAIWAGTLGLGALVWLVRAALTAPGDEAPAGVNALWMVFAFLYHAYFLVLSEAGVHTIELYTVPIAVWLLFWGSRLSDSPGSRQLGVVGLILPSLLLSLGSAEHALWAGSMGLILLVWGQFGGRPNLVAWGGLAILTEVGIQTVFFASNLPWHIWAVAGGLLLVGVAALVERRRREVLQASRNFMVQLNAW